VPGSYTDEDGFSLGQWAKTQRGARDQMSSGRTALLDELGFMWKVK